MRELRQRTGLSLAGLAAATAFSKSSWERYLNGRTLPPRAAVQALCRLAGEPDGRCLALWEMAEAEWGGRAKEAAPRPGPAADPVAAPPAPEPAPAAAPAGGEGATPGGVSPAPRRPRHRGVLGPAVLVAGCAVMVAVLVPVLLLLAHRDGTAPPSASAAVPRAAGPLCRAAACEGEDPVTTGCAAEPDTLAEHRTATGATVQLRYSAVCGTSWARMWGARIGDRVEVTAAGEGGPGHSARVGDQAQADTYVHTVMSVTHPGTVVRACFRPVADGARECFRATADHDPSGPATSASPPVPANSRTSATP
ncbi:DUF2690 domain-containing protein [Streptomyces sp. NPDC090306]|uniref:helix-turn-helix domain-containing protein n=1 Tax=Streptomyces sp. NPDC090306 TaxID=3365961 RepID=UPI003822E134